MRDMTLKECDETLSRIVTWAHNMMIDTLNHDPLCLIDYRAKTSRLRLEINDGRIVDYREE